MRVFLGFALWIAIETWALGRAPAQPQPAFRADDFVNFVGINGPPLRTRVETAGPFKGGATCAPELFYDPGIRITGWCFDMTRRFCFFHRPG